MKKWNLNYKSNQTYKIPDYGAIQMYDYYYYYYYYNNRTSSEVIIILITIITVRT